MEMGSTTKTVETMNILGQAMAKAEHEEEGQYTRRQGSS